jgi:hypothetical protein
MFSQGKNYNDYFTRKARKGHKENGFRYERMQVCGSGDDNSPANPEILPSFLSRTKRALTVWRAASLQLALFFVSCVYALKKDNKKYWFFTCIIVYIYVRFFRRLYYEKQHLGHTNFIHGGVG